jgi:FtsZ-binding cell division protein ZapB
MSVEDARLLLAEVRALQAENLALKDALVKERADVDKLIEGINQLTQAMEAERTAWQEKLAEEKKNSRKNALIMLLGGLIVGGII